MTFPPEWFGICVETTLHRHVMGSRTRLLVPGWDFDPTDAGADDHRIDS